MTGAHPEGLRFEDATVRFGRTTAIDAVSLSIRPGERVALIGPSGAGKTTLLRLANGTLRPTSGRVNVGGEQIARLSGRALRRLRGRIGFIHQDHSLVPNLRVVQNVLAGRLGSQSLLASLVSIMIGRRSEALEAHRLLERVGIGEKLYERTDRLSGGEQQRVAIARALYQNPVAVLADEPVASVDPARARDTVELLTELAREKNLTLVMSLHNLKLAREFFPRVIGLRAGRIVLDEAPDDLTDAQFDNLYRLEEVDAPETPPIPEAGAT